MRESVHPCLRIRTLLDLWVCCSVGFRKSVVMGSRDCGFASMCLCGFTELCVSGLAGPRWRAVHRVAGGVSSLRAFIADAFAPAALRAALASWGSTCGPSPPRLAWRPLRYRRTGSPDRQGGCVSDDRLVWLTGWLAVPFTVSRRSRRQGLRVRCTLASWRLSSNPDDCAAPCCFRSRAIPP